MLVVGAPVGAGFAATIVGAAVAGILGASPAVPALAATRRVVARLRAHRDGEHPEATSVGPGPPEQVRRDARGVGARPQEQSRT